ncbi:histidine kinase dimerization/phospho-acceptor domain-containing protein [Streptomyces inhibens]|uniref:histidine kinase dimerization/phospho-acceptor domain-containing protein n=1 Tax=Streptomyces inhibens TaxID=2293571 RepID=UPI00402AFC65
MRTGDGKPVRLSAQAFTSGPDRKVGGVLVGAYGTGDYEAEHRKTATTVLVSCAVLISLSAVAGHLLSGRAIRPALTALHQQEVFLADAAHDLRAPATSLRALAETALRDDTRRTAALTRTLGLATRMGDLIDDLLTRAGLMALTHGHAAGRPAEVELTVTADGTIAVDDAGPGVPPALAHSLFERFRSGSGSTGLACPSPHRSSRPTAARSPSGPARAAAPASSSSSPPVGGSRRGTRTPGRRVTARPPWSPWTRQCGHQLSSSPRTVTA